MKASIFLFAVSAAAHGVVTNIIGANNVTMPGLSVVDGTPRDCTTARCGAQADTSIINTRAINSGKVGPLGRTKGNGNVDAAVNIAKFMGTSSAATNSSSAAAASAKSKSNSKSSKNARDAKSILQRRKNSAGTKSTVATESLVASTAGQGATSGLPTVADDGTVTLTYHQINGDGAGPLTASIDPSSGGTDESAFQSATITQNVPGVIGLSGNSKTDFTVTVQMPQGMTCSGTVAGVSNVCIVRVKNPIGPFGGSAAFTQTAAARKRSLEFAAAQMRV